LLVSGSCSFCIKVDDCRIDYSQVATVGRLSQQPTREAADVRMTPVRGTINGDVLYLGGGELDRVRAFHLRDSDGMLAGSDSFSQTDEQAGSFPNDVALAVLDGTCP